jgi:hypothetical protein
MAALDANAKDGMVGLEVVQADSCKLIADS